MRLQLQPAYLLHRRAYRDNSELIELLTAEHGRLAAVARGMGRKRAGGSLGALLQPFRPLLVSVSGRGDLLTLTGAEPGGELEPLTGDALLCGFYLNEVLLRVMERFDSHPRIFVAYGRALEDLAHAEDSATQALALRTCEFTLLEDLGYAVDFHRTCDSGEVLRSGEHYRLIAGDGLVHEAGVREADDACFRGDDLLAIAEGQLQRADAGALKRIARQLLSVHLGPQPLQSHEMFRSLRAAGGRP